MIPNAISLKEFHELDESFKKGTHSTIITYCTVGYRSGLEAQKLQDQYDIPHGTIKNLDGIVAYTHACIKEGMDEKECLVDPTTKEATHRVHVFGPTWDLVPSSFESVMFSKVGTVSNTLAVGLSLVWNFVRKIVCCKRS